MATWTDILNSQVDVSSPLTTSLMTALRDNVIALAQQADGSPTLQVGYQFLENIEVTSGDSELTFTGTDSDAYIAYEFIFCNVKPLSDGALLRGQFSNDSGATWINSALYDTQYWRNGTDTDAVDGTELLLSGAVGTDASENGLSGKINVFNPGGDGETFGTFQVSYTDDANDLEMSQGGLRLNSSTMVDAFRFYWSAGNFESGNIYVYGIRGSTASTVIEATTTTGDITVDNATDLQSAIETHDGNGTITVADGTYTITDRLLPTASMLRLEAENTGGATINANWQLTNFTGLYAVGLNLAPDDPTDIWLRATQAYVDFTDIQFDGSAVTNQLLGSINMSDFRLRATDRDCTFTLGASGQEGFDCDSSTNIKVNGNTSANRVIMTTSAGNAMIVLDQANLVADGLELVDTGGSAIGINARRNSSVTLQGTGNNLIDGFSRGLILRQNSNSNIAGTTFDGNSTAVQNLSGGYATYDPDTVTFTGNTTDVDNLMETDGELLAPLFGLSPAIMQFSSGGDTLSSGTTHYLGVAHSNTNASFARCPSPYSGTIKNFRVQMSSTPGTGESYDIEVMDGASASGVAVTISDSDNSASDLVNTRAIVAGDQISIRVITSAGASARAVSCTFEIDRD